MFLHLMQGGDRPCGFPRMRGDVPFSIGCSRCRTSFSPHARGCSGAARDNRGIAACFPRMRGDVPQLAEATTKAEMFSPHARGCSADGGNRTSHFCVFPACAGMFRQHQCQQQTQPRFPRMRGDVPTKRLAGAWLSGFSPHARGCSGWFPIGEGEKKVFPACAGMFPTGGAKVGSEISFPRMRGDVP